MAIEGNEDIPSDEELDRLQRLEDGEETDHDPAVGTDTVATDAPAASPAPAAEASPAPTPSPAPAAAAPAAGAEGDPKTAKVVGVASKDGERVLPYSALQAERRAARAAAGRASALEKELDAAKQQIADMKAGKTPIADLTEEDVRKMEEDFPDQGKKLRALWDRAQTATPAPAPKPADDDSDPAATTQDAIDQIPMLLSWQHEDAEKFGRAQEIDAVLAKSPKWVGKPAVERFAKVTEMVADEFDVQFENPFAKPKPSTSAAQTPAPAATPAPAPVDAASAAPRKTPESLSDFKGGSTADHGSIDAGRASPRTLLNRMEGMTDDEIDAHLAKFG